MTTVTISDALKSELVRIRDTHEFTSLDQTIVHIIRNPLTGERTITGNDDVLTNPVKVNEVTRELLQRLRDKEGHDDYEAVLRSRAGIAPRDHGERPIDLSPISG